MENIFNQWKKTCFRKVKSLVLDKPIRGWVQFTNILKGEEAGERL